MKAMSVRTVALMLVAVMLALCHQAVPAAATYGCNPLTPKRSTCIRGCLSCWKTYGGKVYDMASCCRDCTRQSALLIDFAPSRCVHVQKNWLKRFG